jgi:hypothetical protein
MRKLCHADNPNQLIDFYRQTQKTAWQHLPTPTLSRQNLPSHFCLSNDRNKISAVRFLTSDICALISSPRIPTVRIGARMVEFAL